MNIRELNFDIELLREGYYRRRFTPADVVHEVYRRIAVRGEDYAWTTVMQKESVLAEAIRIEAEFKDKALPSLYGIPFSVKDNIDVAGVRTSCGCAGYDRFPNVSAKSVVKAREAGAVLIGKNTLDQFATGLNGTRTVGGYCRNVFDDEYVSGGSSSGSGVVVAAGVVAFSLGTDTGGSGRIPAAMNNVVGLRPTFGIVSNAGVVSNNRYFDCVPVFARSVKDSFQVLEAVRGFDETDIFSREDAGEIMLTSTLFGNFRFAVPLKKHLDFFGDALAEAEYWKAIETLQLIGGTLIEIDFSLFIEAGKLPFDSGLLAERAVSYGTILDQRPETLHPAVASMLEKGRAYSGVDTLIALYEMTSLRLKAKKVFDDIDVLVTPTVARAYKCEELEKDPIELNNQIGYYTYPIGPLDLCAIAVPASIRPDGIPFGISIVSRAGQDRTVRAIAERFEKRLDLKPGLSVLAKAS